MQVSVYQTSWIESPSFLPVVAAKKIRHLSQPFLWHWHVAHKSLHFSPAWQRTTTIWIWMCFHGVSINCQSLFLHAFPVTTRSCSAFQISKLQGFPHRQWLHYVRNSPGQVGEGAAYAILLAAGPKGQAPPHVLAWLVPQPLREEHWSIVDWVLGVGYGLLKDLHKKSLGWILIPGMKTDWHAIWTGYWGKFDRSTFLLFLLFV